MEKAIKVADDVAQGCTNVSKMFGAQVKKRKGNDDDDAKDDETVCGRMRLPDVISTLAAEGRVLKWSEDLGAFVVLDGSAFEQRYNELRFTRSRNLPLPSAQSRPFARMPTYFVLIRGEKWAGTGSAFKFKNADVAHAVHASRAATPAAPGVPSASSISASTVNIQLSKTGNPQPFTISLQHFLDVTGAGDLFSRSLYGRTNTHLDYSSGSQFDSSSPDDIAGSQQSPNGEAAPPEPMSSSSLGLPMLERNLSDDGVLDSNDVSSILHAMWSCDSKGDQAYFFMRKEGYSAFGNGAIVRIRNGVLVGDNDYDEHDPGLLMVVSDKNAKWKGEPHPTPAQERLGHWCCFLGQVPVTVEGVVKCGDFIGPKGDGSGFGVVCQLGRSAVIGVALVDKEVQEAGVIKTMCFAGLNTIHSGGDFKTVFANMREISAHVECLESQVRAVEQSVGTVSQQVEDTGGHVNYLHLRLNQIESVMSRPSIFVPTLITYPNNMPSYPSQYIPELPKDDGNWQYHSEMSQRGKYRCGPKFVRSWVLANRKLSIVMLLLVSLLLCALLVMPPHPPPPGASGGCGPNKDRPFPPGSTDCGPPRPYLHPPFLMLLLLPLVLVVWCWRVNGSWQVGRVWCLELLARASSVRTCSTNAADIGGQPQQSKPDVMVGPSVT